MTACYRIVNDRHLNNPFDGEGARLYGGRWNSKGVPAVYFSDSAALAMLEILVHINDQSSLMNWKLYKLEIPTRRIRMINDSQLPEDWSNDPVPISTQSFGSLLFKEKDILAFSVPSATLPCGGRNIVVNPLHKQADSVFASSDVAVLEVDPRLLPRE